MAKGLKIDILCNDGSPLGVSPEDIYGEGGRIGIGGAELALLTMCEEWAKENDVVLYNNPIRQSSLFEQRRINTFDPHSDRDILIVFRSPNHRVSGAKGLKVWWSCDQYTVGNFKTFAPQVDKIVSISPFHVRFFAERYGITNAQYIDIPVRLNDYPEGVEKIDKRLIFTSVPERGLKIVAETFPEIRRQTGADLVITSDYRLWGSSANNSQYIQHFLGMENVQFLGAVQRRRLVDEQMKAMIHYYPSVYEELFCIAVAESQCAGALPITTGMGALSTTNMGVVIEGGANSPAIKKLFIEKTVEYLENPRLSEISKELQRKARERFSLSRISKEWDRVFENE